MAVRVYGLDRGQEQGDIVVGTGAAIDQEVQIHIDEDLILDESTAKILIEIIRDHIVIKDWPA